jgi:hypothetical protein
VEHGGLCLPEYFYRLTAKRLYTGEKSDAVTVVETFMLHVITRKIA